MQKENDIPPNLESRIYGENREVTHYTKIYRGEACKCVYCCLDKINKHSSPINNDDNMYFDHWIYYEREDYSSGFFRAVLFWFYIFRVLLNVFFILGLILVFRYEELFYYNTMYIQPFFFYISKKLVKMNMLYRIG